MILVSANSFVLLEWPSDVAESVVGRSVPMAACELGAYVLSSVEMGRVVNAPGSPLVADASVVDIASPPLSLMVERSEGSARSSVEPLNSVDLEPKV